MSAKLPAMVVYQIRNRVNGLVYIGGTKNRSRRWRLHRRELRLGRHGNPRLRAHWQAHGKDAFEFRIVEVVSDVSTLCDKEQYYIDLCQAANPEYGYNVSPFAGRSRGRPTRYPSQETIAKRTAALVGKKRSPEVYDASVERCARMSEAQRGVPQSPEHIAKRAAAMRAYHARRRAEWPS